VLDPNGGIRALWPLFGIANQLLAATALTISTTVMLRTGKWRYAWITGVPTLWLLAVTMTAGLQYIFSSDPRIGFLKKAAEMEAGRIAVPEATKAIQIFNARLDAVMGGLFLVLVATVVLSAALEWARILKGKRTLEADPPPLSLAAEGPAFGEIPKSAGGARCC
jgi:carbon starvation protein